MFYSLPPAGNSIVFKKSADAVDFLTTLFSPFHAFYFNSGAASLAIAIKAIMLEKSNDLAEVLLPAYACPELVSAIQYAGATPVLVDLAKDSPLMDLDYLQSQINKNTVAVIAVSLFGIPERTKEISALLKPLDVYLIEDNAQSFLNEEGTLQSDSDVVILSFGRGKPVSILAGGAALVRNGCLIKHVQSITSALPKTKSNKLAMKVLLYNQMISPFVYWLPESLPFLGLGQTVYKPLADPLLLGIDELSLIPVNVRNYWARSQQPQKWVKSMLEELGGVYGDVAVNSCVNKQARLLRYPILAQSVNVRNSLIEKLKANGLGVSCMYLKPLNQIEGLKALLAQEKKTPNAESFASRIFTLPVHSGVKKNDVEKMKNLMQASVKE